MINGQSMKEILQEFNHCLELLREQHGPHYGLAWDYADRCHAIFSKVDKILHD